MIEVGRPESNQFSGWSAGGLANKDLKKGIETSLGRALKQLNTLEKNGFGPETFNHHLEVESTIKIAKDYFSAATAMGLKPDAKLQKLLNKVVQKHIALEDVGRPLMSGESSLKKANNQWNSVFWQSQGYGKDYKPSADPRAELKSRTLQQLCSLHDDAKTYQNPADKANMRGLIMDAMKELKADLHKKPLSELEAGFQAAESITDPKDKKIIQDMIKKAFVKKGQEKMGLREQENYHIVGARSLDSDNPLHIRTLAGNYVADTARKTKLSDNLMDFVESEPKMWKEIDYQVDTHIANLKKEITKDAGHRNLDQMKLRNFIGNVKGLMGSNDAERNQWERDQFRIHFGGR